MSLLHTIAFAALALLTRYMAYPPSVTIFNHHNKVALIWHIVLDIITAILSLLFIVLAITYSLLALSLLKLAGTLYFIYLGITAIRASCPIFENFHKKQENFYLFFTKKFLFSLFIFSLFATSLTLSCSRIIVLYILYIMSSICADSIKLIPNKKHLKIKNTDKIKYCIAILQILFSGYLFILWSTHLY